MELLDVLLDICFLLAGIACAVFVIRKRRSFDLWVSLPVCGAWVLKGIRLLCYDWVIAALETLSEEQVFSFMLKAHRTLQGMDALVFILLGVALLRLVNEGAWLHRYRKAMKQLNQ